MALSKILLCLDSDPQPSVFDSIVAIDSGAEYLLRHGGVTPSDVRDLVHGAMFTRGGEDLRNTAVWIGGSSMSAGEALLTAVQKSFFGPVRVSVMLDPNGANTTAAAAVIAARRHLPLGPEITAVVLAATGPVGNRVVRMLASEGVEVRACSRRISRAEGVCHRVAAAVEGARVTPHAAAKAADVAALLEGAQLVVAAGAAGVQLVDEEVLRDAPSVQAALDLNAVPPAGLGGIELTDKAAERNGRICYGALGVGGIKMKIHRRAVARLFEANDLVLDADEIYALAKQLETSC